MKYQSTVFSQLLHFLPRDQFQRIVDQYKGDFKVHKMSCWTQFVSLAYAQLRQRDSLRDIETGLEAQLSKLTHLGIQPVKRSTLSDANNKRDSRIYEEAFHLLLGRCQSLHRDQSKFGFHNPISSMDATTINLCHSMFPWARYRKRKGAIKMHLMLNHDNGLPEFVHITEGRVHESTVSRSFPIKPDSIVVFDRGYYDFAWFYALHQQKTTFVVRAKSNLNYELIGQHILTKESDGLGVLSDEDISISTGSDHPSGESLYPKPLRLVTYQDPEGKILRFLTNNETFKPETIALIYKQRWQIELFFKWIKQHLKIKTFLGTSKNAVMTQIWVALIVYLILWFVKKQTHSKKTLHTLSCLFNEAIFERIHLVEILTMNRWKPPASLGYTQLSLISP